MVQKCFGFIAAAAVALSVACAQTDAGISTNIKSKMAADDTVKAYQINVDTRNGVVTLSGDVENAAAKDQAVQIARNTEGVRDVVDQIRVNETAATGGVFEGGREIGRDVGTAVSDTAITSAVKAKFLADTTVKGLQINVDTSGGVVTLTGNVASRAEADRAVMLAQNTEGVTSVTNNLKVGAGTN